MLPMLLPMLTNVVGGLCADAATNLAKEHVMDMVDKVVPPEAMEMVSLLMKGNQLAARTARCVVPDAEEIGDQATSDLLVSRIAVHEKVAWMLRATLAG